MRRCERPCDYCEEVPYVIAGQGLQSYDDRASLLKPEKTIRIPAGVKHHGEYGLMLGTTRMSTFKHIHLYTAALPASFLLFALAWLLIAPTTLYHCWDDAPPFLISWAPPFIHPESNSLDGNLRDYYRAPEWVVYSVWFTFIAGVFVLPAILFCEVHRKEPSTSNRIVDPMSPPRVSSVKPANKAILSICVLLGIAPVALIGWYRWDFAQNRDFEFGYFDDFNRVEHALSHIPGVTITRDWANHDVTLEEFGYYITTSSGHVLHLNFGESDPLRDMTGQQLTNGFTTKIKQEIQSSE